ncbi:hypothetical protein N7520_001327 [Penicillium odoratum]|uniref:uncharacterized protein n=1 Tax=Penicillium odoratum TaxID=1167516 RepID=UPI00254825AA|nr:uncharacterized protein N7520_001327 [Penicillium odoratum]KAJ5778081.1 hypothetical protein N7520_001327 [Penicillium odoratum]
MKVLSLSRDVCSAAVIALFLATTSAAYSNPLATSDQRDLDDLALQIYQNNSFTVLKAEAKAAYKTAHGLPISDEASSSLDAAIEELIFSAIQKAVNNDSNYPKVYWLDAGPRDWFDLDVVGGRYSYDNPDCIYRTIPIDYSLDYVITGYRHTPAPADTTFSLISDVNSQNTIASISNSDLIINDDGSYTITINSSTAGNNTNHIQSTLLAKQLFIRNNLGDWLTQTPDNITVELVGGTSSTPITDAEILSTAKWNLQESIIDYGAGSLGIKTSVNEVNTLSSPSQSSTLGTLTSQASSFGHFSLDTNETLVATLTPGDSTYWVFPVTDPWMITVNPGSSQDSLNSEQAVANSNGTYTLVVSREDPGVYNWVNTTGLNEGTIMVRWQGLPTSDSDSTSVAITTQLVQLSDLASVLPTETKYVTSEERADQLAQRVAGYALRTVV